jgi:CDP-glucose 4,6-dehydratase
MEGLAVSLSGPSNASLPDPRFWAGRRVLLTGHTGFKGSWLALWLAQMGAEVTGLALAPEGVASHFEAADVAALCQHHIADLRDLEAVRRIVAEARPEIVLHLGAQALVRRSYRDPLGTFATNVGGTANLLEALSETGSVQVILVVTSDKVYANDDSGRAFREEDALGGHDPYSASKAAAEQVVGAWRAARFPTSGPVRLGTARGGNVIGGGDDAEDRIVPDIVRAAQRGDALVLRSPQATRPWQHVLDCLCGYLVYAERLAAGEAPLALNIGPDPGTPITVADLAEVLLPALGAREGWRLDAAAAAAPREMTLLSLDPACARALGIGDRLAGRLALEWTAAWYAGRAAGTPARDLTGQQIAAYQTLNSGISP